MTSSPGLRGWSHPQARRGVLQTTTDDDDRWRQTTIEANEQNNTGPCTALCVGGPVISHITCGERWRRSGVHGKRGAGGAWESKVKVTSQKNIAEVGLYTLVSAGFL